MTPRTRSYLVLFIPVAVIAALLVVQAGFRRPEAPGPRATTGLAPAPAAAITSATVTATFPATAPSVSRRTHVFVSGRVQGVGFRDFTQMHATELGLTGWVRNLNDGRVEAVIEGPDGDVTKLLDRVRQGPPPSRVDKVEFHDEKFTGEFPRFAVLR